LRDTKPLQQVHAQVTVSNLSDNVFLGNRLMNAYASCGLIDQAQIIFSHISNKNLVSWTILVSGLTKNGRFSEAIELFQEMVVREIRPNEVTIATVLPAFGKLGVALIGKSVHCYWIRHNFGCNVFVETGLVHMYSKFGCLKIARKLFDNMPERNVVSWNAIISGYSENEFGEEALSMFNEMRRKGFSGDIFTLTNGIKLDSVSLITILSGCSFSGALQQGRRVHALVIKTGFQADIFTGSALIDMYANCASMEDAKTCFERMEEKDVACWNTLISGYGMIGCGNEAIELFSQMKNSGLVPDESTFVSVLCSCSNTGLVDLGLQIFDRMQKLWNIIPSSKHYACVIDLLGRSGRVNEAYSLMKRMHLQPGVEILSSLLTACRIYKNLEVGIEISRKLFELKPNDAGYYVLLSNMYALAGDWDCARTSRTYLKSNNLKKNPGVSSIEISGEIFTFMASQKDHLFYMEINEFLKDLIFKIKSEGYEVDTDSVFLDVSNDVKKDILFHHSEKLAIAFGLMRTKPGTVIRVTKNLRICKDCHSACKFVSKVYARVLVIKDANRFHVFRDGVCSCRDWW
ncbi:hypothetical protein MIMGU_mgv1a017991mg, partial [Erythranthe guttata]